MTGRIKAISEHSVVTHSRQDLVLLAQCLAASFSPALFNKVDTSRDVISVTVNGSQNAFKSGFIDHWALAMLPESSAKHYLSHHGDENYAGEYSELNGYSRVHGRVPITLSYQEYGPETFWERFDKPGIHFDQNIEPERCENPWLEITLRAPAPDDNRDFSEVLSDEEEDHSLASKRTKELFAYAEEKLLRKAGLLRAFKNAVTNDAEMPRLFTLKTFDHRLDTDRRFQRFTDLLQEIRQNPADTSEIIRRAHTQIMENLPSAQQVRPYDDVSDQAEEDNEFSTQEEADYERRMLDLETLSGFSNSELESMSSELAQQIKDIHKWKAYHDQKTNRQITARPQPVKPDNKAPDKIVRAPEGKVFRVGLIHFDTEHKKAYLVDHISKANDDPYDDSSIYDRAPNIELSDEECLFLEALHRADGEPVSRALLVEAMYLNHKDFLLDKANQVVYGLRNKITTLGKRAGLTGIEYIPAAQGQGFYFTSNESLDHSHDDGGDLNASL